MWVGTNANMPAGWMFCDGSKVSGPFQELQQILGSNFHNPVSSSGDGSNVEILLPDLRGYFIRGSYPNGDVDQQKNRAFGSVQDQDIAEHSHVYEYTNYGAAGVGKGAEDDDDFYIAAQYENTGTAMSHPAVSGATPTTFLGQEVRSINVSLTFIIRVQ